MVADAGIASQQQLNSLVDQLFKYGQVEAVCLAYAHGDVESNAGAQVLQGSDQQGGGSLPVHIEVTPNADQLASLDRRFQYVSSLLQIGQLGAGNRCVGIWVEEGASGWNGGHPAPEERLGDQWVTAYGLLQRGRDFKRGRLNPALGRRFVGVGGVVHGDPGW